jgi:WD40 repeat protein
MDKAYVGCRIGWHCGFGKGAIMVCCKAGLSYLAGATLLLVFGSVAAGQSSGALPGEKLAYGFLNFLVQVHSQHRNDDGVENGYGFVVAQRGDVLTVITADHVVRDADGVYPSISVVMHVDQSHSIPANVLPQRMPAERGDLAVLEVRRSDFPGGTFPTAALPLQNGAKAWRIGKNGGWTPSSVPGAYTGLFDTVWLNFDGLDAPRESSGGPVIANDGLVGMVVKADTLGSKVLPVDTIIQFFIDNNLTWGLSGVSAILSEYPVVDVRYQLFTNAGFENTYWAILADGVKVVKSGESRPSLTVKSCGTTRSSPSAVIIFNHVPPFAAVACFDALRLINLDSKEAQDYSTGPGVSQTTWNANLIDVGQYIVSKHVGAPCLFEWGFKDWHDVRSLTKVNQIECNSVVSSFAASNLFYLAVGTKDGHLRLWNESERSVIYEHKFDDKFESAVQSNSVEGLQFWVPDSDNSNKGIKLAMHSWSNVAYVLDIPDMNTFNLAKFVYPVSSAVIFSSRLSGDGKLLAIGTSDGAVVVWDTKASLVKAKYFHDGAVRKVEFAGGDDVVVSTGEDNTVRTYRISSQQPVDTVKLKGPARTLDVDYGRSRLVVGEGMPTNRSGSYQSREFGLSSSGKISVLSAQ